MKDTILEVKDLSVTFTQYDRGFSRRTLHAVEKMDLSVRAGEIVADRKSTRLNSSHMY